MRTLLCFVAFLGSTLLLGAQEVKIDFNSAPPKAAVHFEVSHGVPVRLPSEVITLPPRCRGGRCYGLFATDPSHSFEEQIGFFDTDGKSSTIDLAKLSAFTRTSVLDLAPTDDGVAVLLHAEARQPFESSRTLSRSAPSATEPNASAFGWFLLRFNRDGELKDEVLLQLDFEPVRMAAISPDRFVLTGFDIAKGALLATVQSDGSQVRQINDEGILPQKEKLQDLATIKVEKDADSRMQAVASINALSGFEFGYADGAVLFLCNTKDGASVLSLRGGVVEKVKLKMPIGVVGSSVVSTDHGWLVRGFVSGADTGMLLEFDRTSGNFIRQIDTAGVPPTSVFLREKDAYYALWFKDSQAYVVSSR